MDILNTIVLRIFFGEKMKYIIVLIDGMADYPVKELGDKTPLESAYTPNINWYARYSEVGTVKTTPDGFKAASDVCNMNILGYDPKLYYKGRAGFEAISLGIRTVGYLYRSNFVTVKGEDFSSLELIDNTASLISDEEAAILIDALNKEIGGFHLGKGYQNIFSSEKSYDYLIGPHDILNQKIKGHLKNDDLYKLIEKSYKMLNHHPINKKRIERGLHPANMIWLWSKSTVPSLPSFYEKNQLKGAVISSTDLIRGIGIAASMTAPIIKGATGTVNTNYKGKFDEAIRLLKTHDFVFIHFEGADEAGHRGSFMDKIKTIEYIDKYISDFSEYKLLLLPDHYTPVSVRTHTKDPVPYMLYNKVKSNNIYNEKEAKKGKHYDNALDLFWDFIK